MEWKKLKENRIFIGGHRKSGTTLALALLDGHPDLFIYPYETHFWYSFYPVYIDILYDYKDQLKRFEYIFEDLKHIIKKWMKFEEKDLRMDYETFFKVFKSCIEERTIKGFFNAMCRAVRMLLPDENYNNHKFIVTKDTHSEIHANEIFKLYPKAKFINIVRDPRDNCATILNGWDKHYKNQYDSKERLFRDVLDRGSLCADIALANDIIYEDKYLLIKYEDLVEKTEETMKKIAQFIGIDETKLNLTPTFCGVKWKGNTFTNKQYEGISNRRIRIYDKALTKNQIKIIEYYFKLTMPPLGYKADYTYFETIDAVREHYKWFNTNQLYSNKDYRKYER
jgi:hypothetical protein